MSKGGGGGVMNPKAKVSFIAQTKFNFIYE